MVSTVLATDIEQARSVSPSSPLLSSFHWISQLLVVNSKYDAQMHRLETKDAACLDKGEL